MKEPAKEQIAQRAYEFYLARGGEPGMDVDDWLAAEKELTFDAVLSESRIEEIREVGTEHHVPKRTKSIAAGQPA